MRIKSSVGSVVGQTNDEHWGQVLVSPNGYGVVEIADPEGSARQEGVTTFTAITHRLEEQPVSLGAVEEIAREAVGDHIQTLLLLVPVGQVVYIVLRGEGSVLLKRKEQVAFLMEREGAISGVVEEGDTLLIASSGLSKTFSKDELMGVFDHLSAVESAEKLTLMIHEKEDGFGSTGLIYQAIGLVPVEEEELKTDVSAVAQPRPMETVLKRPPFQAFVSGIGAKIRSFAGSVLQAVKRKLPAGIAGSNTKLAAITSIIVVLFLVSVVVGVGKQLAKGENKEVASALVEAQHAFDEGVALLELNPVKGRERLSQAKTTLESVREKTSKSSSQGREIEKLYQQVADNLTQAMQVISVNPKIYYDVNLLKKGAQANAVSMYEDTVGIVDQGTKTIYTLNVAAGNGQIVGGGDLFKNASFVASHADTLYVLADGGIHAVDTATKKTKQTVVKPDTGWGTIGALVGFGGNIYLLDVAKSRIWKYIATDNGFSEMREYLNPDTLPDLTKATGMAIDGSVWVGTTDGKIYRYTQGRENTFIPKGVDPALGSNLMVYTNDGLKNVYVLDSSNKRIVVLDKDGTYLAQYVWETFEDEQKLDNPLISSILVSETQRKILLLANNKLFFVDLK